MGETSVEVLDHRMDKKKLGNKSIALKNITRRVDVGLVVHTSFYSTTMKLVTLFRKKKFNYREVEDISNLLYNIGDIYCTRIPPLPINIAGTDPLESTSVKSMMQNTVISIFGTT